MNERYWPGRRLVLEHLTDIAGLKRMTRAEVISWNELLDAREEAHADAAPPDPPPK